MLHTPIGRLRAAGLTEGASYLLLLGIAMPLKYLADMPYPVSVIGWVHGLLFILFCLTIALAMYQVRLPVRLAVLAFIASLVPFGPFLIDGRLQREETQRTPHAPDALAGR